MANKVSSLLICPVVMCTDLIYIAKNLWDLYETYMRFPDRTSSNITLRMMPNTTLTQPIEGNFCHSFDTSRNTQYASFSCQAPTFLVLTIMILL